MYIEDVARPKSSKPTDGELEILRVLWSSDGRTVRQVHRELHKKTPVSYSSVLTRMQIMHQKGYLRRDEGARPHVYYRTISESQTKANVLRDVIAKLFGGSTKSLMMHALRLQKASPRELKALRKRLEELDEPG
jgi:BlaI family transcriptional regulator, penicillinase repressor